MIPRSQGPGDFCPQGVGDTVGAIHESPAAAKRRFFRCRWHRGNGTEAVPYGAKNPPPQGGGFHIKLVRPDTPSGDCQIRTTPDHTSFTRVPTSNMSDSLAPGTAGRPVGRFYSMDFKQNPSGTSLPAAARRKNPPFPKKRGINFSMTSAVRPTVFYSSFDKQKPGQFASGGSPLTAGGQRRPEPCPRRCRCTSRSS